MARTQSRTRSHTRTKKHAASHLPVPAEALHALENPRRAGRRALILGGAALAVGAAAMYRRLQQDRAGRPSSAQIQADLAALGWGDLGQPVHRLVGTADGAQLAVWDVGDPKAKTVVLPHCWGCSHAIWVPVARQLVADGFRVVLYDQRGHGASTRGTIPLSVQSMGDDLATVLAATDVHDVVLAGHSMGGMTIMSLATFHPDVLKARASAIVLVATAAAQLSPVPNVRLKQAERAAASFIASPLVTRSLNAANGQRFVRGAFGTTPAMGQIELTRQLFADCPGAVRGGYLAAMAELNLLEGIATIDKPTTVMVGTRDRLTAPARARQMVAAIPGARLVTLQDRGHMLPLEATDAVTDEITLAAKN
ncbi:MAG TPA: alpha/beta hydrolase [Acidimicrobiales bacterium]